MAMVVQHNIAAQLALGELNKNNDKLRKSLEKVSSGQKIVTAKDSSSGYSISEKMRVKIHALDQANQNVQNGSAMLKTAEAGIQQQIDLVRTIREKVVDANNDTNTEEDRKIMEKEILQFYDQIDQIGTDTMYNSKRVLFGETYTEIRRMYYTLGKPQFMEDSVMDVIPNVYDVLDEVEGPFDIFSNYTGLQSSSFPSTNPVGGLSSIPFTGGDNSGTAAVLEIDFSNLNLNSLRNVTGGTGFKVRGYNSSGNDQDFYFVLTKESTSASEKFSHSPTSIQTPSQNNSYPVNVINISSGNLSSIVSQIASSLRSQSSYFSNVTANGTTLSLTSANKSEISNKMSITSFTAAERYVQRGPASSFTGSVTVAGNARNEDGSVKTPYNKGTITIPAGTTGGVKITIPAGTTGGVNINGGIYELGANHNGVSNLTLPCTYTFTNASTASQTFKITGTEYYWTSNNSNYEIHYKNISGLTDFTSRFTTDGKDPNNAHLDIDLSGYKNVENLINDFAGKTILINGYYVELYDSGSQTLSRARNTQWPWTFDLNNVRTAVRRGQTISQAFATQFPYAASKTYFDANGNDITTDTSLAKTISTLRINARQKGSAGNSERINVYSATLGQYNVDFNSYFNGGVSVPEDLDGKGFRWYCSTDDSQWFNIIFKVGGNEARPKSGTKDSDIRTIEVEVSNVKSAADLVNAIYEQINPILTSNDPTYNHFYRVAKGSSSGVLTIYDNRLFDVSTLTGQYQERGAKIADGVIDNVYSEKYEVSAPRDKKFIIHDTDKASMNLAVHIPSTRLKNVFNEIDYSKGSIKNYSLNSKDDRIALLGNKLSKPPVEGVIDKGLTYLLNAAVLVGAQNARLEHDLQNLVVQVENTTASESTIRDADMAKEMTDYTKNNVLLQASQSMLAQANQNSSAVLNLLR